MTEAIDERVARTVPEMTRLRHEAAILRRLRHPGVVRFVDFEESDDHAVLRTEAVDAIAVSDMPPVDLDRARVLLADVASTLADVHALGFVHGDIAPDSVLVRDSRTVLRHWSEGGEVGPTSPAADVAGWATLVDRLVPLRTPGAESLLALAERACAAEPAERPSARGLLVALAELESRRPPAHRPSRPASSPARRRVLITAALAAMAVGGMTGSSLGRTSREPATSAPARTPPLAEDAETTESSTPDPTTTTVIGTRVWPMESPVRVTADGRMFEVGEPGDVALAAAWACAPATKVAVLRPRTGDVFVFDDLPSSATSTVSARRVGSVPGATALHVADVDHDGCLDLIATGPSGETVVSS